jgi:hypothetical protein
MRQSYSLLVEDGRILSGPYGSAHGEPDGAFNLVCPDTRATLHVIVASSRDWIKDGLPGRPWEHVSVSARTRCPTWSEMCWVKELFWGDEECVIQFHPPRSTYVDFHPFVLHLWRPVGVEIPRPPTECVGPVRMTY